MKVLMASSECAPFFKTGGLGDVIEALPKALKKNVDVRIVLPYFSNYMTKYQYECTDIANIEVNVGWRKQYCGIKKLIYEESTFYFIDNLYYFERESLYGYYDDGERFAFFQNAIIEMLKVVDFIPDVIHCNDYHTAMIPFLLQEKYNYDRDFSNIRTLLTIHNIEFQGVYGPEVLPDLFGVDIAYYFNGNSRWDNAVNFLKTGIIYATHVNTVSPSYACEIQTADFGAGLENLLQSQQYKLSGIINGIDFDIYNPKTDKHIPSNYIIDSLELKAENKRVLQKTLGLPQQDVPILSVVSRLTFQKGIHLILDEFDNILQKNVQIIILGSGDCKFEQQLNLFKQKYPEKCAVQIAFDIKLAQLIYAGSDIFLMPSAFEPCGLSQMIAMRYGTLPVVHEIGGLKDTVATYNPIEKTGTGFGFREFSSFHLMKAIEQAIDVLEQDKKTWKNMMIEAMSKDFSWKIPSQNYINLYKEISANF